MKLSEKSIMLKFGFLASTGLALTLSGCSSTPSIEEQTKLIEYEKCLDFSIEARTLLTQSDSERNVAFDWKTKTTYTYGVLSDFQKVMDDCKSLRP